MFTPETVFYSGGRMSFVREVRILFVDGFSGLFPVEQAGHIVLHLGHQPAGGRGGAADADALFSLEPGGVDFGEVGDHVRLGVDLQALAEEHAAVGTLLAADEEHEVVAPGKLADVGDAVGYLSADGVERLETAVGFQVLDFVDDVAEALDRLGGLRVEE